jgi:hypothetical protein
VLRAGLAGTALVLVAAWLLPDPVGSTTTRLVLLFAAPALVAVARTPVPATALAALGVMWLLPPVVVTDLMPRDTAPVRARAEALVRELDSRGPVGRVEVVPLRSHEESRWVAGAVPLARGWLRHLDTARAPLFYDESLSPASYVRWLRASGVSHVALPPGALDWPTGGEAELLRNGVPGLREVWSDGWWRLFEVSGGGLVRGEGRLVSSDRTRVVVDVPARGQVELAVWWSPWLSTDGPGGCVRAGGRPGWTTLHVDRPGRYEVTSRWRPDGQCG